MTGNGIAEEDDLPSRMLLKKASHVWAGQEIQTLWDAWISQLLIGQLQRDGDPVDQKCQMGATRPHAVRISDLERKMVEDTLLETFQKNKLEIAKAVSTPSPFLEMLRDHSLIPEKMYHRAQEEYQKLVPMDRGSLCTYSILMELEKNFSTKILAVLFHPANLQEYPPLAQIQKHFKDVPLDESASEASVRSPVRRSSLDERASAVSAPQSSVQGSSEKCSKMAEGTWLTLRESEIKGSCELAKHCKKTISSSCYTLHYLKNVRPRAPRPWPHLELAAVQDRTGMPRLAPWSAKERPQARGPFSLTFCPFQKKFILGPPRTLGKRKKILPAGETRRQPKVKKGTPFCQAAPAQNAAPSEPQRSCFQKKKHVPGKTLLSRSCLPARRGVVSLADRPKYQAQLQARKWISVVCRLDNGRLYKDEFVSLYRGKCILTERGWCTPLEFLAIDPEFDTATWTQSIHSGGLTLQTLIENKILKLHPHTCSCDICKEEDPFPENDNECFMCKDGGELFCCDSCPKSFHRDCHISSVSSESSAEWNCTFCIIRKNKEKEGLENNHYQQEFMAMKQQMYPEQQLKCEFLLMRMYCCRESFLFTGDPSHCKAYSPLVRKPMWLDKVKKRLNDETYNTVEGFVRDMRLIFYNCKKFNKDNHFGYLGAKLETKFERDFKAVFDIKGAGEEERRLLFP
ncbi:nuclear body protein SP140-like protein [Trichosurus vulpecula]|uniref:nuclear body protein SP140-like protein n=1 Tax=Trichosurus vulpecula TaxID=9337 RepID=UPI00186B5165|nr:nuclear body protein SP140-like protein [Trichosurus vulpecula]